MSDVLQDLQPELKTILQAVPLFADSEVTVVEELKGDFENEIEQDLAKLGVAVIVSAPTVRPISANVTSSRCIVSLDVMVLEDSLSVGEGVAALQAVAAIINHIASIKPDRTRQSLWKLDDRGFRPGVYPGNKDEDQSDKPYFIGKFEREVKL